MSLMKELPTSYDASPLLFFFFLFEVHYGVLGFSRETDPVENFIYIYPYTCICHFYLYHLYQCNSSVFERASQVA